MAPIKEILEDRTVEELKDLARKEGLSGYSNLRKNEIVDLLTENMDEETIRSHFDPEFKSSKTFPERVKDHPWLIAGISICLLAIVAGLSARQVLGSPATDEDSQEFTTYMENAFYNFSFSVPSSWLVGPARDYSLDKNKRIKYILPIRENKGEKLENIASIAVFRRQGSSLEEIKKLKITQLNTSERARLLHGPSDTTVGGGVAGFEYTTEVFGEEESMKERRLYTVRDNHIYRVIASVGESSYPDYEDEFEKLIQSFSLLEPTEQ